MENTSKSASIWSGTTPQLAFIFGVIAGVAATTLIGFFLLGPDTFGKSSKKTTTTNTSTTNTSTAPVYGDVAPVGDDDYVRGPNDAKLTLIEYSDYECPFCKRFHPTMQQVMEDYDGEVRWVYRHFPLSFHANAQKQAEAGLCVGDLGDADKYWEFTDLIFERTTSGGTGFDNALLPALAEEVGVDKSDFEECLNSGRMADRVAAETADGTNAGASGTPTTFLVGPDGKTIDAVPGAEPYEQVKARIDAALASL